MAVSRLELDEFTVFKHVDVEFSPGVNVLIGANATGKTHLLKLLYCVQKSLSAAPTVRTNGSPWVGDVHAPFREKLARVFLPDDGDITRLIRTSTKAKQFQAKAYWSKQQFLSITLRQVGRLELGGTDELPAPGSAVYLPSRDVLSMYEGFIHAYTNRELSFDETYYDLCVALNGKPLRGDRKAAGRVELAALEEAIQGKVEEENGRFYLKTANGEAFEAHLVAEGWRKLATLAHLISNGGLRKGMTLYWDEPETNLNPKLVATVARVIMSLAVEGIQIILASHDYLLTNELSLQAEYETPLASQARLKFHCLSRKAQKATSAVEIDSGDTLADLKSNPILDEFAAHYGRERALFVDGASAISDKKR